MPTPASPGTNQFRCEACGRHFNTASELKQHAAECEAAKRSQVHKEQPVDASAEKSREWKSVP